MGKAEKKVVQKPAPQQPPQQPSAGQISADDLFQIIGAKEWQILKLQRQVAAQGRQIQALAEALAEEAKKREKAD